MRCNYFIVRDLQTKWSIFTLSKHVPYISPIYTMTCSFLYNSGIIDPKQFTCVRYSFGQHVELCTVWWWDIARNLWRRNILHYSEQHAQFVRFGAWKPQAVLQRWIREHQFPSPVLKNASSRINVRDSSTSNLFTTGSDRLHAW